jgi:putative DNA methylase
MSAVQKRKLIEVALPLEVINRESAREKSIRHGHPSTLHLWWARRPLAAARAVLFAQLVDDPSSLPEQFPTKELQKAERERLHKIIERLVVWENTRDVRLLAEARAEIMKSCGGNPPAILDPFAGGGTIPLEAQRLGLEAHASDLNPVAVLINKALIEIPPKFRDRPPVFPGLADSQIGEWKGCDGLAADVRSYGDWLRDQAHRRIGDCYPEATLEDGTRASVIAWIWARTVQCPNPACGVEMPLVRSWWLGKKKGKEAYVVPTVVADPMHPSGRRVAYNVGHGAGNAPREGEDGTVSGRTGATCVACAAPVPVQYLRDSSREGRAGKVLIAVVAAGKRSRAYLSASTDHVEAANIDRPTNGPDGDLDFDPRAITPPNYGMSAISDLFTSRQLLALTVFSDLIAEARLKIIADASAAGLPIGQPLEAGGRDSTAYADALAVYLAMALDRVAMSNSSLGRWNPVGEKVQHMFGRQAISMVWDYPEVTPFGTTTGSWSASLEMVVNGLAGVPGTGLGEAVQSDASTGVFTGFVISTDPPYYDNVPYSALSDFFYVWLRRALRDSLPSLFNTMLVPKSEELVANPYRHDGKAGAKRFFEEGFRAVFARARETADDGYPMTVYYAFKQSESDAGGEASTGWETLLDGMVSSGWAITGTWPVRSEMSTRMRGQASNALASCIVLALRPRPIGAATTDRRGFIAALQAELPQALRELQQGAIAPVDLPQAAIGPGMAVFSRYSGVIEADGSKMTVRSALARINEILDQVLNEQEGDFDPTTRFAIAWYRQHGYATGQFGDANNIANARNTSVEVMDRDGILVSRAGKVTLQKPADLPSDYAVLADDHTSAWEAAHHLIRVLEGDGVTLAGDFLKASTSRPDGAVEADLVKELAFLLFSLAEKNGWTKDALSFNNLATSWPEIVESARTSRDSTGGSQQGALDFDDEEN